MLSIIQPGCWQPGMSATGRRNPSAIFGADLHSWFDPSRNVVTGGAGAAVDEDPVSDWTSADLANLAQSIGNDPSYETSGISPQIVFDGTDDTLVLVGAFSPTSGFLVAWVSELLNGAPANETIFGSSGTGFFIRQVSTTETRITDGTNTRIFTHAAVSGRTIHMINGDATDGLRHFVNGVESAAAGTSFDAFTLDEMGAEGGLTPGEFGLGDVVLVDGPQTLAKLDQLGEFLA